MSTTRRPQATVLIDPLVPEERERFLEALDRDVERRGLPVTVLLTVPWHERSITELVERYAAADEAPAGVEPFVVAEVDETLWWLPEHATLVAGDVLVGADGGIEVCPDSWLDERSSHASIRGGACATARPSARAGHRLARRAGARRTAGPRSRAALG